MRDQAFIADAIFDGQHMRPRHALLVRNGQVSGIVPTVELPSDHGVTRLGSGLIVPGFVDLQVNGGGGVMINDDPCVEILETVSRAHAKLGTTAFLPTLITDTREKTRAAIEATVQAIADKVPGIAGLHLEGPHLAPARKGAHDQTLIRPMDAEDLAMLLDARSRLPSLMTTLAPESVSSEQIAALAEAGITVSLGHTDADYETCGRAVRAGARCVTHLFNAMSQLRGREPGAVGAALDFGELHAGLIADAIHVHPSSIATALRAKQGPGQIFLVTDAMAPAGTGISGFMLNGRRIERNEKRLTLADGTLAGADLDMATAVGVLVRTVGVAVETALRMATSAPAQAIGRPDLGHLNPGVPANFIHLGERLDLRACWRAEDLVG